MEAIGIGLIVAYVGLFFVFLYHINKPATVVRNYHKVLNWSLFLPLTILGILIVCFVLIIKETFEWLKKEV